MNLAQPRSRTGEAHLAVEVTHQARSLPGFLRRRRGDGDLIGAGKQKTDGIAIFLRLIFLVCKMLGASILPLNLLLSLDEPCC